MADHANIEELDPAQNALTRLCRAQKRGTGCHLSAAEVFSLGLTSIGEMWNQPDPRKPKEPTA